MSMRPAVSKHACTLATGLLAVSLLVGCDRATTPSTDTTPAPIPTPAPADPIKSSPVTPADLSEPVAVDLTVTDATDVLTAAELWQRLQQPGDMLYVVLLRHALAPGTGDPANFQLEDCSTQRNLSDEGRAQARQIGQAFRDRGVAVQQVLSSQWCRCLETAELMDVGTVIPYPALNSFFRDRRTAEAQTTETKQFFLTQETPGVIVMVTHQVNITGITDIVPRSGEAVVVQVDEGGLTQIGQFMPES
jgi:phosphohistidine phosphatase SixA